MPPKRSATANMHLHANRLASFLPITKPKSRAREGWPLTSDTHPHLTPENMASAGFYYSPIAGNDNDDTCACFLCGVSLGGWSEEDDPWSEHASRGLCAWAETVCAVEVGKRKAKVEGKSVMTFLNPEDLPSSETSSHIRRNTFYSKEQKECWWPHDGKADFKPTPENLARAGFVYSPSADGEDTVRCPYCEYTVEGWEDTDDPLELHQKKRKDCLFFTAKPEHRSALASSATAAAGAVPPVSKNASGSSSSQTKKSRRMTKASAAKRGRAGTAATEAEDAEAEGSVIVASQVPNTSADTDNVPEASLSQSQSQSTRAKRATKPRSTTAKSKGRGKKASTVDEDEDGVAEIEVQQETLPEVQEEEIEKVEEESEEAGKKGRRATKAKPRVTKARSRKTVGETVEAEPSKTAPVTTEEEVEVEGEVEAEEVRIPRAKSKSKSSSKSNSSSQSSRKPTKTCPRKKPLPPLPTEDGEPMPGSSPSSDNEEETDPSPPLPPKQQQQSKSSRFAPFQNVPTTSQSQPTRVAPQAYTQPQAISKSQPSRPLSQLDRFANIPSSPPPAPALALSKPSSKSIKSATAPISAKSMVSVAASTTTTEVSSRVIKPLASASASSRSASSQAQSQSQGVSHPAILSTASKPKSQSSRSHLEQDDKSAEIIRSAAVVARETFESAIASITTTQIATSQIDKERSTSAPAPVPDPRMTLEQLVRLEMRLRKEEMEREGEAEIQRWEEKCRAARKRLEGVHVR